MALLEGSEREEHEPGEHDQCPTVELVCCEQVVDRNHADLNRAGTAHADYAQCTPLLDYQGDPISLDDCNCDENGCCNYVTCQLLSDFQRMQGLYTPRPLGWPS